MAHAPQNFTITEHRAVVRFLWAEEVKPAEIHSKNTKSSSSKALSFPGLSSQDIPRSSCITSHLKGCDPVFCSIGAQENVYKQKHDIIPIFPMGIIKFQWF